MYKFTWIVVWSAAAVVSMAEQPQRGGQQGGASATIDPALLDEFAPVNPRGPAATPPQRRGTAVPPGQNVNDPAGAAVTAPPQIADPAAGGNGARQAGPGPNRMFLAIDANNDGIINAAELRRAAASLKILDADNDGNITLAEVGSTLGAAGAAGLAGGVGPMAGGNPLVDQTITQNDKNGDGQLTPNEMPPQAARMFPQMDANGDGILTRDELNMAAASMATQFNTMGGFPGGMNNNAGGGAQSLMQYDRNGDGRLTANEVPPQLASMLQSADQNRDGAIDMQEMAAFAQMRQQMGQGGFGRGPGGEFPPADNRGPRRGQ